MAELNQRHAVVFCPMQPSGWPYAPKARGLHFANMLDAYALSDEQRQPKQYFPIHQ